MAPHARPWLGALLVPFLAMAAGCEEEPPLDLKHGFVKVQFARSQAATESPYTGTAQITMTMVYDSCFTDFYAMNPNWTTAGIDGALAFGTLEDGEEGWRDRLCDPLDAGQARCTIADFQQELDVATQLTVTYAVEEDPENKFVKFGPLPLVDKLPEFICEGGSPRVQANAQSVRGINASGSNIWEGEALDVDMATPGQGKAIVLRARRE